MTKSINLIKAADFKPENIILSDIKITKTGAKKIYINYNYEDGDRPKSLKIQLPRMKTPFGISGWSQASEDSLPKESTNDSLQFSFGEHSDLVEKFNKVQDMVIDHVILNSKKCFGNKKMIPEVIKANFKPSVKYSLIDGEINPEYPPSFRTKLYKDSSFNYSIKAYDEDKNPISLNIYNHTDHLPKGSECIVLLECNGVFIVNDTYGIIWLPSQIKIYKSQFSLKDYAFLEDDQDGKEITDQFDKMSVGKVSDHDHDSDVPVVKDDSDSDNDPLEKTVLEDKPKRKRRV